MSRIPYLWTSFWAPSQRLGILPAICNETEETHLFESFYLRPLCHQDVTSRPPETRIPGRCDRVGAPRIPLGIRARGGEGGIRTPGTLESAQRFSSAS